jgi:DNA-binding CsgD family transcriptional regulator
MAEVVGDFETLAASYNTVGTATLFLDYEKGCELLERCREIAMTRGYDAMVANTWSNLGTASGELHRFVEAEPLLSEGIDYATDRELDAQAEYMRSWRALARMHLGRWSEAGSEAAAVAERAAQGSISRIMALVALGRLRARRGDPGVWAVLDEALEIARRSGHLQRVAPVAAARAEAAALEGRRERAGVEATLALDPAMRNRHPWFAGELLYWQLRAGQAVESPEWIAPPFALQISGRWVEAAAEWEQRRCPYERARALAEGDGPMRRAALDIFDRLGARPAGEALRQRLRADGVGTVPRGPRASTRTNPYGLTAREVEILTRLAEGLRNAEIAARLHISARTVDHHVSSILAKLEVPSREAAARFAAERGLLPPN